MHKMFFSFLHQMKGNVVLLLLVVVVTAVYGMPSGAPLQACEDLMPQHGSDPQMSTSPYQIDLSPFNVSRYMDYSNNYTGYWYKPGETYTCKFATCASDM